MRVQTLLCRLGLVVASVTALAGLPSGAAAQTSTGSIRGYVTDSVGNALEGARVVAVSVLSSTQREVKQSDLIAEISAAALGGRAS